jgi:8-oxo-dGTP diphosphatase
MDELLILKRTLTEQGKANYEGGMWDIPGGTVEKIEFPSSTAVRETKEETNLDVTVERILYEKSNMDTKKNQVFTTLIYLCSLSGTDETIELDLEEHDAYKWVTKEEI